MQILNTSLFELINADSFNFLGITVIVRIQIQLNMYPEYVRLCDIYTRRNNPSSNNIVPWHATSWG